MKFEPVEYDYSHAASDLSPTTTLTTPTPTLITKRLPSGSRTETSFQSADGRRSSSSAFRYPLGLLTKQQVMLKRLAVAQLKSGVIRDNTILNRSEITYALGVARASSALGVASASSALGMARASSAVGVARASSAFGEAKASHQTLPYPVPHRPKSADDESQSIDSDSNFDQSPDLVKNKESFYFTDKQHHRRISWAFDYPNIQTENNYDLSEMKAFLKRRIRHQHIEEPEFISKAVTAIHSNSKRPATGGDQVSTKDTRREKELVEMKRFGRPNSSPGRIDPKTKMVVFPTRYIRPQSEKPVAEQNAQPQKDFEYFNMNLNFSTITFTPLVEQPIGQRRAQSANNLDVNTNIPKPRLLRPHTSVSVRRLDCDESYIQARPRSFIIVGSGRTRSGRSCLTSPVQANISPMRMFSRGISTAAPEGKMNTSGTGQYNTIMVKDKLESFPANDPFRNHTGFKLLTNQQLDQLVLTSNLK